jgi:hypothetical protein
MKKVLKTIVALTLFMLTFPVMIVAGITSLWCWDSQYFLNTIDFLSDACAEAIGID